MTNTNRPEWTISSDTGRAPIQTLKLSRADSAITATMRIERLPHSEREIVRVTFGYTLDIGGPRVTDNHLRAEAARLLAICFDTMGDLEADGEPLEVDAPELVSKGIAVEIHGATGNALVLVAPTLGNEIAEAVL